MNKIFMNAKEVQDFLEVSRTTAYQIINKMNRELVKQLMKDLFLLPPLNRLGSSQKRSDDRKYLDYLEKTIDKVLGLGDFVAFDWSGHFEYKPRIRSYERI